MSTPPPHFPPHHLEDPGLRTTALTKRKVRSVAVTTTVLSVKQNNTRYIIYTIWKNTRHARHARHARRTLQQTRSSAKPLSVFKNDARNSTNTSRAKQRGGAYCP